MAYRLGRGLCKRVSACSPSTERRAAWRCKAARTTPTVLLVGSSMLSWPNELCERLVAGGRRVIRYDVRDTGRSESYPPGKPGYSLADLVDDAVGVLDATATKRAHVAGMSTGGWIAQLLALGRPERVATLRSE